MQTETTTTDVVATVATVEVAPKLRAKAPRAAKAATTAPKAAAVEPTPDASAPAAPSAADIALAAQATTRAAAKAAKAEATRAKLAAEAAAPADEEKLVDMSGKVLPTRKAAVHNAKAVLQAEGQPAPIGLVHYVIGGTDSTGYIWTRLDPTGVVEPTSPARSTASAFDALDDAAPIPSATSLAVSASRGKGKPTPANALVDHSADPLVVNGIRYANLARAQDARLRAEAKAKASAAKAAKASGAAKAPAAPRGAAAAQAALEAAQRGELPVAPVFTAPTSLPYQKRLEPLLGAIEAGDIAALQASNVEASCKDSRVAAMGKFRDLAVIALQARKAAAKADAKAAKAQG